jgi:hypothetical protein
MEIRAYIARDDSDQQLRVTVHEDCTLYSRGVPNWTMSWAFPLADDGVDHLFGAQPEQPFEDADRILAEHGWTREGRWVSGDVVTGTYARITRTKHVLQGTDPVKARFISRA